MNELALFAGAGGGLLASHILGIRTVVAVELDEYCQHVLVQRQNEGYLPPFAIWDDVCSFDGKLWRGTIDIVSGGFPCQAFSSAARGRNIASKDLWGEMFRVAREISPEFVFAENVAKRAILQAKQDLESIGYSCKWAKVSAKDLGADHERDRYWLLAHSNDNSKFLSTLDAKAQGVSELRNRVWETYAGELRVSDGVACRMDRLKATGNGQVPVVAAFAFLKLLQEFVDERDAKQMSGKTKVVEALA